MPPSYALISDLFPPGRRGTAFGIYNLGPPIGAALGIAFGASIAAAFDWRYAFISIGVDRPAHGRGGAPVRPRAGARPLRRRARAARRTRSRRLRRRRCACSSRDDARARGARQRRHADDHVRHGQLHHAVPDAREGDDAEGGGGLVRARRRHRHGLGDDRLGPRDRPADAAIASAAYATVPGAVARARAPLLRRVRLGADLAARVGLPHRCADAQLLLPLLVGRAGAGRGAAGPARDVGRAAAARDELHRPGARADLGRRGERLVRGARHARTRSRPRSTRSRPSTASRSCSSSGSHGRCVARRRPHDRPSPTRRARRRLPRPHDVRERHAQFLNVDATVAPGPKVDAPAGAVRGTTDGGAARVQGYSLRAAAGRTAALEAAPSARALERPARSHRVRPGVLSTPSRDCPTSTPAARCR